MAAILFLSGLSGSMALADRMHSSDAEKEKALEARRSSLKVFALAGLLQKKILGMPEAERPQWLEMNCAAGDIRIDGPKELRKLYCRDESLLAATEIDPKFYFFKNSIVYADLDLDRMDGKGPVKEAVVSTAEVQSAIRIAQSGARRTMQVDKLREGKERIFDER